MTTLTYTGLTGLELTVMPIFDAGVGWHGVDLSIKYGDDDRADVDIPVQDVDLIMNAIRTAAEASYIPVGQARVSTTFVSASRPGSASDREVEAAPDSDAVQPVHLSRRDASGVMRYAAHQIDQLRDRDDVPVDVMGVLLALGVALRSAAQGESPGPQPQA